MARIEKNEQENDRDINRVIDMTNENSVAVATCIEEIAKQRQEIETLKAAASQIMEPTSIAETIEHIIEPIEDSNETSVEPLVEPLVEPSNTPPNAASENSTKKYVCQTITNGAICGKSFMRNWGLKRHCERTHIKVKWAQCNKCQQKFTTKEDLKNHSREAKH